MATLIQELGIACIREDWVAAYALADMLAEQRSQGKAPWPAIRELLLPDHEVLAAFSMDPKVLTEVGFEVDEELVREETNRWLTEGGPLLLVGLRLDAVFQRPNRRVATLETLRGMTQDERKELIQDHFCRECFRELKGEDDRCHCWNDE